MNIFRMHINAWIPRKTQKVAGEIKRMIEEEKEREKEDKKLADDYRGVEREEWGGGDKSCLKSF